MTNVQRDFTAEKMSKGIEGPEKDLHLLKHLGWDKLDERAAFIKETPSGLYSGTDVEGTETIVFLTQGEGMDVWKPTHNGWYEVVYYDSKGNQEGTSYKR